MKPFSLVAVLLGLMAYGYFFYRQHQPQSTQQTASAHQVVSQLRAGAHSADAEANDAATGKRPSAAPAVVAKAPAPAAASPAGANPRAEIEAALGTMHVTTIMPGPPGVFILGKQDYTEGEDLPLPNGRKARVVAVENDGVRLTCEGMTFRLDPPAAPDLAALRKKK